jgi:predicted RND superfamily exporter protein
MFRIILKLRVPIVVVLSAATVFFALQLPTLRLDPDTEAYVPKGHPMRVYWEEARERFGVGREILVAVHTENPDGVFTPEILRGLTELTEGIKALPSVIETDVTSLSDAEAIVGTDDGLEVEPFFENPPATREEALAVRRSVYKNTVYLDRLVSRDASIATIIVTTYPAHGARPPDVYREIAAFIETVEIPGARVLVAGNPAVEAVYGVQMAADLTELIPLALIAVIVILYLCFRTLTFGALMMRAAVAFVAVLALAAATGDLAPERLPQLAGASIALAMLTVRGVALPAIVVVAAVVWTWGIQALLGLPIYIAGTLVPPLLLAIGSADGIHILERYYDLAAEIEEPREIVLTTMSELWRPVVLTSVTTAAGFGSLLAGSMTVYQVFGLTTAVGVMVAMLFSLTFLPAVLSMLPRPSLAASRVHHSTLASRLMAGGRSLDAHRRAVAATGVLATAGLLVSATWLRVDFSWVETLKPGTPVLEADRLLRSRHGGTMPLMLIARAPQPDGIKQPEVLRAMDRVLDEMSNEAYVGDTRSLAEYVRRMNQALNEDRAEEDRIPDEQDLVAQLLLLYTMSGDPGEFDDVVDYDYQAANLTILLRSDQMSTLDIAVRRAEELAEEHLSPLGLDVTSTGSAVVQTTIFHMIMESQVWSLGVAFILCMVFMSLLFRSPRDALVCMIPVAFTGIANFGGMGLFGVPLGPDKAMLSAIALGIGIDYAIHLMSRFRDVIDEGASVQDAIAEMMRSTGRAILFNAGVVVAGFGVLAFSSSPSNASFGLLIATNMAVSCVAALLLMPPALAIMGRVLLARAQRRSVRIGGVMLGPEIARDLGLADDVTAASLIRGRR